MLFLIVLGIGLIGAYALIKVVDEKHTTNHIVLERRVNRNQEAIKKTTKEILGYDPFDIRLKGKK